MGNLYAALHQSNEWLKGIGLENKDVVFGALFGVLAYLAQGFARNQAEVRQRRDQLFSLMTRILDLKSDLAIARADALEGETVSYNARIQAISDQLSLSCTRALELADKGRTPLGPNDVALIAEASGVINHPRADQFWERALALAKDPIRAFELYSARGMQLYEWGRLAEGAAFFEKFRADLQARGADPDFMGRCHYAQAIREYPAGQRSEGRNNLKKAWDWYARHSNEALKIRRFNEINRALAALGDEPFAMPAAAGASAA